MNQSKFLYSKQDKDLVELEPKNQTCHDLDNTESQPSETFVRLPNGYQKNEGSLLPNIILIISGGSRREADFFKELSKGKNIQSVRVSFVSKKNQGLMPDKMKEQLLEIVSSRTYKDMYNNSWKLDDIDKIFLVTDVDDFRESLVLLRDDNQINDTRAEWIISNPCIEIWLYYCFKNNPKEDFKEVAEITEKKDDERGDRRSQRMKTLCNNKIVGGCSPVKAFENINIGIENSKLFYSVDQDNIPILFATEMFKVAEYILKKATDFDEFIQKRKESSNYWRQQHKLKPC